MIREILRCGCTIDGKGVILDHCPDHRSVSVIKSVYDNMDNESTPDHPDVTVPEAP